MVEVALVHQLVADGGQVADLALQVGRYDPLHAGALLVQTLALQCGQGREMRRQGAINVLCRRA